MHNLDHGLGCKMEQSLNLNHDPMHDFDQHCPWNDIFAQDTHTALLQ